MVSRFQRESDVKGDVSGGGHEDDGEELKGPNHVWLVRRERADMGGGESTQP